MYSLKYPLVFFSLCFTCSLFLQGNESTEEEFYILPDFVVTDDDDKGYYSANTLAGTRTNELTKNIPMTISTVNAEMIEDFKMKTLEDLGNFVPSIEAEGNVYNNQEIRFRGLLTRNQLYEFMPRYSPLDWYNVGRSDIIRGANSLIYGQADPGGKVNVISKTANLNKDKGSVAIEIGDKDWHKYTYDVNTVLGDNTAARLMFVDKYREFDANYKYQSFTGATLELMHNISPKTRVRLHLETGVSERSLIGGTFKVGNGPTGLPNGIVADPKIADLMSDELLQEIANYSDVNVFNGDYNSIYPVNDDNLIYGFLDRNNNGVLEKNFTDLNNNGTWDTSEIIYGFSDTTTNGYLDILEPFTYEDLNENGQWDALNGDTIALANNPNAVGLENANLESIVAFVDQSGQERWSYEDQNGNGKFDVSYDSVNGVLTGEPFAYIDSDNDGVFNVGSEPITSFVDSDGNGRLTLSEDPYFVDRNRDGEWVALDETYEDLNDNGVYDDSDYASGGLMVRSNNPNIWGFSPAGGTLVPDFIDDREDIRNLFRGINYANTGTGFGPDSYSRKSFDYVLADFEHSFSDKLSMKASFAFEDLVDEQLSSGWSANQLNFSSGYGITVRFPTLRSLNDYNADPNNANITSPFEAILVDLTNANYAHKILDTIDTNGIEQVRTDLQSALGSWTGNLNQLQPHNDADGNPVFADTDNNGLEDDMIDYFVDNFLDLSAADTTLEKYYELAKFGGRVKDFLEKSHATYGSDYGYVWGNTPSGGGRALGDLLYDALTGSESEIGAPTSKAISEIYNLDRFVDVTTYRTQLKDYDLAEQNLVDGNYPALSDYNWTTYVGATIDQPNGVSSEAFSLDEDGERLIYDSIPTWLISGLNGEIRDMNALPMVETYNPADGGDGFDGKINGNNPDEVELQKRAIAKKVYDVLINDINDPNSDNEFWDATKEIYDFFKYELHETSDYSWMWEQYIQPNLLTTLDAVVEDTAYLDDESQFIDMDGDGIRDAPLPSIGKSGVEILQPFVRRQWKKSSNRDNNRSVRITYNYNEDKKWIPGKQQLLFGIDLDNREASRSEEQLVSLNARAWGDAQNLFLRNDILSDYVGLYDILYGTEGDTANFDFNIQGHQYDGAPNWITNNKIPLSESNVAQWEKVYQADATVESKGLWFAASGSYLNGKLRTLIGIRRDQIETDSEYSRFTLRAVRNDQDDLGANLEIKSQKYDETIYSPSIGGLYWFTKNLAIFGNYSESVISPNGFQFDVFGDITPPETGQGKEIGFKMSTSDNVINGQLTVFSIDKKNEQRQNISWPMLTSIYPSRNDDGSIRESDQLYSNGHSPAEIYDYYLYYDRYGNIQTDDATGDQLVRAEFNPKGFRVADEEVRSEGLELDLYYNPTKNVSVFLGYAYLETTVLESALDILEGLATAGTSDHNLNLTFKYSFKQGKYKGLQLGLNQKYRSAALLSHYFVDLDGDNQADYIPVDVIDPLTGNTTTAYPRYNTLWLEDQHRTDIFVKWSGKIKKHLPWTVIQLNVNNIFNNRNLISTGLNNARYTEGRNIVLSTGFYF